MPDSEDSKNRARRLRREPTPAEEKLWEELRAKQLRGFKFRRQHPIGPYFADFCCLKRRLIVEVDGDEHTESESYDQKRTAYLMERGHRVIRFWNEDVLEDSDSVLAAIVRELRNS
jgi:very-short-patch-repair endonuclease